MEVLLREVLRDDLASFFVHQMDPEAAEMAAFPARDEKSFMDHWAKILADEDIIARTVLVEGAVAGNIVSFSRLGEREVGYWIGRDHWGRGVATAALAAFLNVERQRPLSARVASRNVGSIRVLDKCGFSVVEPDEDDADPLGDGVEETVLRLDAPT